MGELLQFVVSGITIGAVYGLIALGFTLIYNASHLINFAQGEFVMLGGMATVFLLAAGLPLPVAAVLALLLAGLVGIGLYRLGIRPARGASVVGLIIITIGASILLRGLAGILLGRDFYALPPLGREAPYVLFGAVIPAQSLWILLTSAAVAALLWLFFARTLSGKAMLAAAYNPLAAALVGIDGGRVVLASFALAGTLGALAGFLITPLAPTHFQVGVMLGLKGFAAAIVGGLGSGPGAFLGGMVIGLAESLAAGYLSSAYKDAVAFVLILLFLLARPSGLLGVRLLDRV